MHITSALNEIKINKEMENKEMLKSEVKEVLKMLKTRYSKDYEAMEQFDKYHVFIEWQEKLGKVQSAPFINTVKNYIANDTSETWPDLDELLKAYEENKGKYQKTYKEEMMKYNRAMEKANDYCNYIVKRKPRIAEIETEKRKLFLDMVVNNLSDKPAVKIDLEDLKTMQAWEFIEKYFPGKKYAIDVLNYERDLLLKEIGESWEKTTPEYWMTQTVYVKSEKNE